MIHNCRWVLADGSYCEASVKYKMLDDGGEPGAAKVRQYEAFCPEHLVKFNLNKELQDLEDWDF